MNFSWQLKKFGECAELIRDTCLPDEVEEAPYIGLEHIEEGTLRLLKVGNSNDVISTKSRFEPGDILFGKLRPYFRKVVRPSFSGVCSTDIWVVRAKHSTDQGYLFYWMASQEFVNSATQASEGTKMPRAKWDFLERIEKTVPPLPEQRAIAHILGTLDDKIELNSRMNQTLEAMAQALFESWFVDFEPFRDQGMEESPLGEIPVGWRVATMDGLGEVVCGKTPLTGDKENYGGDIPFVTIPDMRNSVFVTHTTTYLSQKGAATQPKKLLPKFAVCVSCIATPGLVAITSEPSYTNQQINSIICNSITSPYWCYLAVTGIREEIITGGAGGSATLNLNKAEFSKLQVVKPDSETMQRFHNLVEPLFSQILSNNLQIITLAAIRDALLPKLLSGGIRVKDAEKFVEVKI
jgi:type I restriction enzyme S subunit